jgi:hypothetical protein
MAETKINEQELLQLWRVGKPVLCIPGPGLLDEAVAMVVAHLVEQRGIGARAEKIDALSLSRFMSWETDGVELVCLCYVAAATAAQIRYAIRRIRKRLPDAAVVIALLGNVDRIDDAEIAETGEIVQQSVREIVEKIASALIKRANDERSVEKPAAA